MKKYRKNTDSRIPKVAKTKNRTVMLLPKCAVCDSKKLKLIKQQEASGLLGTLGIKTTLSKIPLVGTLFVSEVLTSQYKI